MLGNADPELGSRLQQQFYLYGREYKMWRTEASSPFSNFSPFLSAASWPIHLSQFQLMSLPRQLFLITLAVNHSLPSGIRTVVLRARAAGKPIIITTQCTFCQAPLVFTFMLCLQTIYDVGAINYAVYE